MAPARPCAGIGDETAPAHGATGACFPEPAGLRDDRSRCFFGRHAAHADGPTAVSDCQGERNARSAARPKPMKAPKPFAAPRCGGANRDCPVGSCLPSSVRCADACQSVDPKVCGVSQTTRWPRRAHPRSASADTGILPPHRRRVNRFGARAAKCDRRLSCQRVVRRRSVFVLLACGRGRWADRQVHRGGTRGPRPRGGKTYLGTGG